MTATTTTERNALVTTAAPQLLSLTNFAAAFDLAKQLCQSDLLPATYQNKPANVLLAMDIAERMQMSLIQVVQNLTIIEGKPGWSSQFLIAAINSSGRFAPLRFEIENRGPRTVKYVEWEWSDRERRKVATHKEHKLEQDVAMRAYTTDRSGQRLTGSWVSYSIAVAEGWYTRRGSKWQTMGEQMLTYRAASFFARIYAPELTNGMLSVEELQDMNTIDGSFRDLTDSDPSLAQTIESAMQQQAKASARAVATPSSVSPAAAPTHAAAQPPATPAAQPRRRASNDATSAPAQAASPAPAPATVLESGAADGADTGTQDDPFGDSIGSNADGAAQPEPPAADGSEQDKLMHLINRFLALPEHERAEMDAQLVEPIEAFLPTLEATADVGTIMTAVHNALNAMRSPRDVKRVHAAYKEAYTRLVLKR